MIFCESICSRACLSAEDEEGKKLPSSLEQLFSLFFFCKARRRRAGMCDHREQIPRERASSPSHPHVDVRPSGANPPERASSRHIRTWMCDHREQIPRRERHPVTSATWMCDHREQIPPERASSRHIRTWMCDHREQTPSEGVTEIPVSPTLSEGVTRSLAVPVWNRCCCTGSTCRYHAQSACPVSSRHVQSAYPVSVVFCQKSYPLRHRFSSTLLFSYA